VSNVDTVTGSSGADVLVLGTGGQTVLVSDVETVTGGAGNDTITFDIADTTNAYIDGGNGDDFITGGAGSDTLVGGAGVDTLVGGDGNDVFVFDSLDNLFDSADSLFDTIYGGDGTDTLRIDADGFFIAGVESFGHAQSIEILAAGQATANTISIVLNSSALSAGIRNVSLAADTNSAGSNSINVSGAGAGQDWCLTGSAGVDYIVGGAGNDTIASGSGNDDIRGGAGDDSILGGAGSDVIRGGDGGDTLIGGSGADTLTGGAGSNVFVFAAGDSGQTTGFDNISDYTKGAVGTGNLIDYTSNLSLGGSVATASATAAAIDQTTGIATFASGSGTTIADALADIATSFTAATDTAGELALFRVNNTGNFYLFISDGAAGVGSNDVVVQLVGVTAIAGIDLSSGNLTITS